MCPQRAHIALKRDTYCYRRRLPTPCRGELLLSLRTGSFREAQHLATILDRAFDRTVASCSTMHDNETKLREILRTELEEALRKEFKKHQDAPPGTPLFDFFSDSRDVRRADIEYVDNLITEARSELGRRYVEPMAECAEELIERHGLPVEMSRALMFGLAQNRLTVLEKAREWLDTGPVAAPGLSPSARAPSNETAVAPPAPFPKDPATSTARFSDVLESFIDLMVKDQGWRGQTLAQNQATYRMFTEVAGDLPVASYTRRHCGEFYELLRKLPALYAKSAEWKGKSLKEIAEATDGRTLERLSMKTMRRHFSALGRFFRHCIEQGYYEGPNPAHGFSFPQKGRPSQRRNMWEGEKLRALFTSPVWMGCLSRSQRATPGNLIIQDEKYWLPLLGLFHGNRLEEFAQLRRSDVRCEEGIWYLDINDEDDKQVKNEQSKRKVPVHPEILKLGFLDYVERTAPAPIDAVFPQLKPGGADGKRGHAFTKWWTRYRQQIGLYEKGLDYHSFRHGVTTKLYDQGVPDVFVDELTGHEGQGTGRKHYLKDLSLARLFDAISKVQWPEVDLEGIASKLQKNPKGS